MGIIRCPTSQDDMTMNLPMDTNMDRYEKPVQTPVGGAEMAKPDFIRLAQREMTTAAEVGRKLCDLTEPSRCQETEVEAEGAVTGAIMCIPYRCCDCGIRIQQWMVMNTGNRYRARRARWGRKKPHWMVREKRSTGSRGGGVLWGVLKSLIILPLKSQIPKFLTPQILKFLTPQIPKFLTPQIPKILTPQIPYFLTPQIPNP